MQAAVFTAVNGKVYASCRYQQRLFQMVGITSEVVYEPINEFLFFPGIKRKKAGRRCGLRETHQKHRDAY